MDFFSGKINYGGSYELAGTRKFSDEEKAKVSRAVVVDSEYGPSACFYLKNGRRVYTPMSHDSKKAIGEELNMDDINILTLHRDGDADIERID